MKGWRLGLAAAETTVACAGDRHRLRWEAGELRALDHDDVEGERTLAALGGEHCTCIEILDAWARHSDDLCVLLLASRGPTDAVAPRSEWTIAAAPASAPGSGRRRVAATYSITLLGSSGPRSPRVSREDEVGALLGLGGGIGDRLFATVAAAWIDRLEHSDRRIRRARPQLHAALYGRAVVGVRAWLGRPDLEVDLEVVEQREQARLTWNDGRVRAELPVRWLVDVWARGFATIAGRFCLDAASSDGRHWLLSTIDPDLGAPELVRLELPDVPAP